MACSKFTQQEIDYFNDKIGHVLENETSRKIFHTYLQKTRSPVLLKVFSIWQQVHDEPYNDELLDLIEEIDSFNINPLYSLAECDLKRNYIKQECCRILERIRPQYIAYLQKHHQ